jgi:hypothetical protein
MAVFWTILQIADFLLLSAFSKLLKHSGSDVKKEKEGRQARHCGRAGLGWLLSEPTGLWRIPGSSSIG